MKLIIRNTAAEGSLWAARRIADAINAKAARTSEPFVLGVQGPGPFQRACVQSNWLAVCKESAGSEDLRKNKARVPVPQPTGCGPWHIRGPL